MTLDELCKAVEDADLNAAINAGSDNLPILMDRATQLFEPFTPADQAAALAIMWGLLMACLISCGGQSEFERDTQTIMGFEDHLKLFTSIARVAYRESYTESQKALNASEEKPS